MDGIFISYRRDDSAGYAGRLYDRLVAHFGAERVFMDVEGIEPGLDFVEAIEQAVGSCRVLIAVIGDEWTTATDASGRRRLDDPNDFIRLETGSALQRGIRVVPVLVGDAVMPHANDLPEVLKPLTRRQAIEINHKQWEASTGELIRTLESILNTPQPDAHRVATATQRPSPHDANEGEVAPKDDGNGKEQGGSRRSIWRLTFAIGTLAAVGFWFASSDPKDMTTSPPSAEKPSAPVVTADASKPSAPPPSVPIEAPPKPEALPDSEPLPPVPSTVPIVDPGRAAPPRESFPRIREFRVEADGERTRLCYRVSDAETVTLTPRPGVVDKGNAGCVEVDVEKLTTFTLTARQGERSDKKVLRVIPKLRTASSPATDQPQADRKREALAKPTPGAATTPGIASPYPLRGERWAYRSSGKWSSSPKRRFEIVAQSVENGVITDELRMIEPDRAGEVRRSRGSSSGFIAWNAIGQEFSPYLGAYVGLGQFATQSGFATPDMDSHWTQWYSKASLIGQESVNVPAGAFNAFKIEVSSTRNQSGSFTQAQIEPVRVRYLIWYAPEVKRYVRMQRIIKSADGTESENDLFELVSHRLP